MIIVLVVNFGASAQKPHWIRNSVNPPDSYGETSVRRIAVHPDGNVFVLGQYYGSNDFNGHVISSSGSTGGFDGFLAKYNADGDLIWIKQIFKSGEFYSNHVIDIKVDGEGDLIFSGSCLWPVSILGSDIGIGYFIAKVDKDGNLKWLDFLPLTGGALADHDLSKRGNRIGIDKDNNIFWLTYQTNDYTLSGGLAVVKYNSFGTKLETILVTGNANTPTIQDFSVDTGGAFIISIEVSGGVSISGGPTLFNSVGSQFVVAKFNSDGQFVWTVYSNSGSNRITTHSIDDRGNVYLGLEVSAGASIFTPHGEVSVQNANRSIAKVSENGKMEWVKTISSSKIEDIFIEDIFFGSDGFLYITGSASGDEFKYQSYLRKINSRFGFVLKIDTSGNFSGAYVGDPGNVSSPIAPSGVYAQQSVVDTEGNIYTSGGFWRTQMWGCVSSATDGYSFFLLKHSPTASQIHSISGPESSCDGTEISLSTNLLSNEVLYKWYIPGATVAPVGTSLQNSLAFTVTSDQHLQPVIVSITDNCDEYFTTPFVLEVLPRPEKPVLIISEKTVCPEHSAEFKIATNNDDSYRWTLPEGMSSITASEAGGIFEFEAHFLNGVLSISASNSCGVNELTFPIATHKTPSAPILTGDEAFCPGVGEFQRSIEHVPDAIYYEWNLPVGLSFNPLYNTDGTTLHAIADTTFQTGEISVRAVGVCKAGDVSKSILITLRQGPENAGVLTGPDEVCTSSGPVTYRTTPVEKAIRYWWTISDNFDQSGVFSTIEPFISLNAAKPGKGFITVSGEGECSITGPPATITLEAYSPLQEPTLTINECDTELTVSDAEYFNWYFNGLRAPQFTDRQIGLEEPGIYHVTVENYCGLIESNKVEAHPVKKSIVLIPNVITPNGDGKNDFLIIDKSLPDLTVSIINRWGQIVYFSSDYQNQWTPDDLAPGTYFLTVKSRCLPQEYRGWLSVIK